MSLKMTEIAWGLPSGREPMHRRGAVIRGIGFIILAGSILAVACKSSESQPPDPLVVEYCAACSERPVCLTVVDETLKGVCPDQTRAYYVCVTENACDPLSCDAEWQERQSCFLGEDAGTDAGSDGGTDGAP